MTPADDHVAPRDPPSSAASPRWEPPTPEAEAAFLAAVDEGLADDEAGRTVSSQAVRRWVESWGTEAELPMPEPDEG